MAKPNTKRKSGPITKAFLKGLSILLPAVITIAIFAWAWDILRTNVVELTISGVDMIAVFPERELSSAEIEHLRVNRPAKYDVYQAWIKGEQPIPSGINGERTQRMVLVGDLPEESWGYSPPMKPRGLLQYILDANQWRREYHPVTGRPERYHWFDYLLASVLGLVLVVLLGFLARNFIGRRFVSLLEWFVTRVPVVKSIYPHAKQLVDFFFTDNKPIEFDTVAIVEYPRVGLWSICFVTGSGLKTLQDTTKRRLVTIYVPSSPAPMTGYTMLVAAEEVIPVDMSVEDAMKFVISGGVLAPKEELVKPASGAQYALSHTINEQIRKRQTTMLKKVEKEVTQAASEAEADSNRQEAATDKLPEQSTDKKS